MTNLKKQRLLELLADRTIFGVDENELMELEMLKNQFPDWEKDLSLELVAAAIGLSQLQISGELPSALRTKIFALADDHFGTVEEPRKIVTYTPTATESVRRIVETETKVSSWQWLGWAFAAAACIALAVVILTRSNDNKPPEIVKTPITAPTRAPELTAEQKSEQLLASAADAVKIPLINPKNDKEVVGEMVWSNAEQKGFAHFKNLPANDTAKETYQMWIVDGGRAEKKPLSAGVFNVRQSGEITVPVNAQLKVEKPQAIAVTVEKPGGVVVSDLGKVVATAKI